MSTFAFDECVFSYNGIILSGPGENGFVSITENNELWNNRRMVDGRICSSKILSKDANIEVTTRWNSRANRVLSQAADDRVTAPFICTLPDGTRYSGPNTRVQKNPDSSVGQDHGDNVWMLFSEVLVREYSNGEEG